MNVEQQIEALRAQVKNQKRVVMSLCAVFAVFMLAGFANGEKDKLTDLTGKSLTLVTDDGRVWLTAEPLETGGKVWIRSNEPMGGIQLSAEDKQKTVAISKTRLFPQIVLGLADGDASLLMTRQNSKMTVVLGNHPDKHGYLVLLDDKEKAVAKLPAKMKWPPAGR